MYKKVNINKEILVDLYITKDASEIAKIINCSTRTVIRRLKTYNIKIKNKLININKKQLIQLYINEKTSSEKISEIFNCVPSTVIKRLKKYNIKTRTFKETFNYRNHSGKNNPAYIDGRTPISKSIRTLQEYDNWRKEIFERDNFTCQQCEDSTGGNLVAHHKKQFAIILNEFLKEYDQFSPLEDKETLLRLATKYKPFWNIENGKTLCKDCHKEKHLKEAK